MTSDSTEALEEGAVANLIAMSLDGKVGDPPGLALPYIPPLALVIAMSLDGKVGDPRSPPSLNSPYILSLISSLTYLLSHTLSHSASHPSLTSPLTSPPT